MEARETQDSRCKKLRCGKVGTHARQVRSGKRGKVGEEASRKEAPRHVL